MISYHAFAATNPAIKATVCEVSSACPDGAILSVSLLYYYLFWKWSNRLILALLLLVLQYGG